MAKRKPTSLKLADLLEVLRKSGSKHATSDAEVLAEAPRNKNKTYNLVDVIAWLISEQK